MSNVIDLYQSRYTEEKSVGISRKDKQEEPTFSEKPALKVARSLYDLVLRHHSSDSLMFLAGDSTNCSNAIVGKVEVMPI